MVIPPMSCFRLLILLKAIIGTTEKVFSKALLVFKMAQWFRTVGFYWEVRGSMSLQKVTLELSLLFVVFGVGKSFLSRSLIFLISVSIEGKS